MNADRKGFTLIELLIVVIVIGILATLAVGKFSEARSRALGRVVQNELRAMAIQQEIYHHTTGLYAGGSGPPDFVPTPDVNITINSADRGGWAATATHAGWTTEHCGIWVGTADPSDGDPATEAGVVGCTK